MLVEFGERRQVLSITCDDLDVLLQNVKDAFGVVSAGSFISVQKFDREWEDWIDVTAASSIVRSQIKLHVHPVASKWTYSVFVEVPFTG